MSDKQFAESAQAETACREVIRNLRNRVVFDGDVTAAMALLGIATHATTALHSTWLQAQPRQTGIPDKKSAAPTLAARREMLAYWIGSADLLPAFSYKKGGKHEAIQGEMIEGLRHGPFKSRRRKDTELSRLVQTAFEFFQMVQLEQAPPKEAIMGEIWRLPKLDQKSKPLWAKVIVKWLWPIIQKDVRNRNSEWRKIAAPERELERDKRKATKTLDNRKAKLAAKVDKRLIDGVHLSSAN